MVETVKVASKIYASGQVNEDPFGEGWLFTLMPESSKTAESLLDAAAHQEIVVADK